MTFIAKGTDGADIKIYSISGDLVRKVVIFNGSNTVQWDGRNEENEKVARGIYIFKIIGNNGDRMETPERKSCHLPHSVDERSCRCF
jgi:flagellar hook assembly protein FlgD